MVKHHRHEAGGIQFMYVRNAQLQDTPVGCFSWASAKTRPNAASPPALARD
jgi:hypothetical protein